METWATVTIVLVSNCIIAALSYLVSRLQAKSADERLEMQLKAEREARCSERKREVRSEPLLNLRAELARLAQKYSGLISTMQLQHTRVGLSEEEAKQKLQEIVDDWNRYVSSSDWGRTLYTLDDNELIAMADEVRRSYASSHVDAIYWLELSAAEKHSAEQKLAAIGPKIAGLQSLINQRLEAF